MRSLRGAASTTARRNGKKERRTKGLGTKEGLRQQGAKRQKPQDCPTPRSP
jgi:hypothetical protein